MRLSAELIRSGLAPNASKLSELLVERRGLHELRRVLLSQFAARRDVLKARSALLAVEDAVRANPTAASGDLLSEVERVTASAHEFAELRLLNALRTGTVPAKPEDMAAMEQLLGAEGTSAAERLALPEDADVPAVRNAAAEALAKWQRRAESPMASQEVKDASRVLIRTCEGLLTSLA